jgi:hypothetical protein
MIKKEKKARALKSSYDILFYERAQNPTNKSAEASTWHPCAYMRIPINPFIPSLFQSSILNSQMLCISLSIHKIRVTTASISFREQHLKLVLGFIFVQ